MLQNLSYERDGKTYTWVALSHDQFNPPGEFLLFHQVEGYLAFATPAYEDEEGRVYHRISREQGRDPEPWMVEAFERATPST